MASEIEHMQHDRKKFKEEEPQAEFVMLAATILYQGGVDQKTAVNIAFNLFDEIKVISGKRVQLKCEIEAKRRKGY